MLTKDAQKQTKKKTGTNVIFATFFCIKPNFIWEK